MIKIKRIEQHSVLVEWDEAEKWLEQAVESDHREEGLKVLKGRCAAGMNQLWKITEDDEAIGWATSTIYTPDGEMKVVQIDNTCCVDFKLLLEQLDHFEAWARSVKADYIEVIGRRGWQKALKPHGFNHNFTSCIKAMNKELH